MQELSFLLELNVYLNRSVLLNNFNVLVAYFKVVVNGFPWAFLYYLYFCLLRIDIYLYLFMLSGDDFLSKSGIIIRLI